MTCKDCRLLLSMDLATVSPAVRLLVVAHIRQCPDCDEWMCKKESEESARHGPLTDKEIAEVKALADETIVLLNGAQE